MVAAPLRVTAGPSYLNKPLSWGSKKVAVSPSRRPSSENLMLVCAAAGQAAVNVIDAAKRRAGRPIRVRSRRLMAPPSTSAASRRFLLSADLVELLLPLHVLGELHELFGLHEDSLFRAGIVAAADVGHVTADDILHDGDEIGVDAAMARGVLS